MLTIANGGWSSKAIRTASVFFFLRMKEVLEDGLYTGLEWGLPSGLGA